MVILFNLFLLNVSAWYGGVAKYNAVQSSEYGKADKIIRTVFGSVTAPTVVFIAGSSMQSAWHHTNNRPKSTRENEQHIYLFDERKSYIIPTQFPFYFSHSPV